MIVGAEITLVNKKFTEGNVREYGSSIIIQLMSLTTEFFFTSWLTLSLKVEVKPRSQRWSLKAIHFVKSRAKPSISKPFNMKCKVNKIGHGKTSGLAFMFISPFQNVCCTGQILPVLVCFLRVVLFLQKKYLWDWFCPKHTLLTID